MPMPTRELQRKYQREWLAKRKQDFFCDKVCVRCGSRKDLQLHHIDPALKVSHKIWSWSDTKRNLEISKCEVLCRSCHISHHRQEYAKTAKHGTTTMYKNYGCRCSECRRACAVARREYRARVGHQ